MTNNYLLAGAIILVALWFLYTGIKTKAKNRFMLAAGSALLGISQLLKRNSIEATTILAIGFILIVMSFYVTITERGRLVRPTRPTRRRRRR